MTAALIPPNAPQDPPAPLRSPRGRLLHRPAKRLHRQFKHPNFPGIVTVSGAEGDDAKTYQERQVKKAIDDASSGS